MSIYINTTQQHQITYPSETHKEDSPRQATFWAIKHILTHLKEQKSYNAYCHKNEIILEINNRMTSRKPQNTLEIKQHNLFFNLRDRDPMHWSFPECLRQLWLGQVKVRRQEPKPDLPLSGRASTFWAVTYCFQGCALAGGWALEWSQNSNPSTLLQDLGFLTGILICRPNTYPNTVLESTWIKG